MGFMRYNNNPKQRDSNDDVIRAIAFATNKTWEEVYSDLAEEGKRKGYMPNEYMNWMVYLLQRGYKAQLPPKRRGNTRYTVQDFCLEIAEKEKVYIVKTRNNYVTAIKNQNIYDTFDCSKDLIEKYWIIENE